MACADDADCKFVYIEDGSVEIRYMPPSLTLLNYVKLG